MKTIMMKRQDIIEEYGKSHGVTRYKIDKAVENKELGVYDGSLAGSHRIYFRVDVEQWVDTLPAKEDSGEKEDDHGVPD